MVAVAAKLMFGFCLFKQKTAYEMRISDWSSDVCSSDLTADRVEPAQGHEAFTLEGQGPTDVGIGAHQVEVEIRFEHRLDGLTVYQCAFVAEIGRAHV